MYDIGIYRDFCTLAYYSYMRKHRSYDFWRTCDFLEKLYIYVNIIRHIVESHLKRDKKLSKIM